MATRRLLFSSLVGLLLTAGSACSDGSGDGTRGNPPPRVPDAEFPVSPDAERPVIPDADVPLIPDVPDLGFDGGALDIGFYDGGSMDVEAPVDAGMPSAEVNLTFEGACQPDFGGQRVVAFDTQLSVSSVRGPQLQATLQLDLGSATGAQLVSTRNRLQTGLGITLITGQSWTNLATDPRVVAGDAPDPIKGTLLIGAYRPAEGLSDLTFVGVTLQSGDDDSLCLINGTLATTRLGE